MTTEERLRRIAAVIEAVDQRCAAADGPVTPTRDEITDDELIRIYKLATDGRIITVGGPIPPSALAEIGRRFAKSIVVLHAWDPEEARLHTASWGDSEVNKQAAAIGAELAARSLGADLAKSVSYFDFRVNASTRIAKVLDAVESAVRVGAERDEPEGSRYATFTDTLLRELARELRVALEGLTQAMPNDSPEDAGRPS